MLLDAGFTNSGRFDTRPHCRNCGDEKGYPFKNGDYHFCTKCGGKITVGNCAGDLPRWCVGCKRLLDEGQKYCPTCGALGTLLPTTDQITPSRPERSKPTVFACNQGHEFPPSGDQRYCTKCGGELSVRALPYLGCRACGNITTDTRAGFCRNCGGRL